MGNLKPGTTYIYERVDDTVYARESGSLERHPVGWEFDNRTSDGRPLHDRMMEDPYMIALWRTRCGVKFAVWLPPILLYKRPWIVL